jgi:hypothetical protein
MIMCSKCNNETRTAALLSPMGDIMVTGPAGSPPLPISAQVCIACGHIDLYAPQSFENSELIEQERVPEPIPETAPETLPTN